MQKTVDGITTDYVYSGSYVIAETGKTYLRGLSYHAVIISNEYYYYFCNSYGDVTGITDEGGSVVATYDYDEFGNLIFEYGRFDNDLLYAGEFIDNESENYYLRSRYYDPTVGRFTQQDSFLGVDDNPLSLNRYTYCHNNPITFVDPSGHEPDYADVWVGDKNYSWDKHMTFAQDSALNNILGRHRRGEINSEQFLREMQAAGINAWVKGGRIGQNASAPSNFIPAENVQVIFGEQLSYEDSLKAVSLFGEYNEGLLDKEGLKKHLNELSAMAIVYNETNYDIYDKETYGTGESPVLQIVDGIPAWASKTENQKTYNDILVYSGHIGDRGNEEDLRYGDLTKDELRDMKYISWADFFPESMHIMYLTTLMQLLTNDEMQGVGLGMINHFIKGSGTDFYSDTLNNVVAEHPVTKQFMGDFNRQLVAEIVSQGGYLTKIANDNSGLIKRLKDNGVFLSKYSYGGGVLQSDTYDGLTMCIHSWTQCDISVKSMTVTNNYFEGVLQYKFIDDFGLDRSDIDEFGYLQGFRSWYILQHYDGYAGKYVPFRNVATVECKFSGTL